MGYTKEEMDFNAKVSTVITAFMNVDALEALELLFTESLKTATTKEAIKELRYNLNKCSEAIKSNRKVLELLKRDLSRIVGNGEQFVLDVINDVATTVYDIVDLEEDDRKQVQELIKEIKLKTVTSC